MNDWCWRWLASGLRCRSFIADRRDAVGVYLAHILPIDLMRGILPPYVEKLGISIASSWWDIATFVIALTVSVALCIVLRRMKPLAWLVG